MNELLEAELDLQEEEAYRTDYKNEPYYRYWMQNGLIDINEDTSFISSEDSYYKKNIEQLKNKIADLKAGINTNKTNIHRKIRPNKHCRKRIYKNVKRDVKRRYCTAKCCRYYKTYSNRFFRRTVDNKNIIGGKNKNYKKFFDLYWAIE